ncbi:glycosyltransferase [Vibrio chagasii]|uniref:glycosyltransferase n=1 Tax=Vibrio chagasii TaxID=170679 RepID=UPI003BB7DB0D
MSNLTYDSPFVAVVMSVYKLDELTAFRKCIDSLLNQTYQTFDIFIAVDGNVGKDLEAYLISLTMLESFNVFFHDENKGLAKRLNELIKTVIQCDKYVYIARMDADDICNLERFDKQVDFLKKNAQISVVGSDVIEINEEDEEKFYKKMKSHHDEMYSNIIQRCPFNHPSVMFNIDVFQRHALMYKDELTNTQDYYLWVDMLSAGLKFANINEPLLFFRVNSDFHRRRGLKKAINDFKSRVYAFKKLKVYSFRNLIHVFLLFFLRLSPSYLKSFAYRKLR